MCCGFCFCEEDVKEWLETIVPYDKLDNDKLIEDQIIFLQGGLYLNSFPVSIINVDYKFFVYLYVAVFKNGRYLFLQ